MHGPAGKHGKSFYKRCPCCKMSFDSRETLSNHIDQSHPEKAIEFDIDEISDDDEVSINQTSK